MSVLKPFRAYRYNSNKINDFSKVVSPPYDVISEEQQEFFHHVSPHNFTHIDLSVPGDLGDPYKNAARIFHEWLKQDVLVQDEQPSVYFYKQEFKVMGQKYTRTGFIGLLELQDIESSTVKPHEKTHQKAVDDRLELTKALESNLSSIFVGYADKNRVVEGIYSQDVIVQDPIMDITDSDGVRHIVWKYDNLEGIKQIAAVLLRQNLFIADGHHRYRVACEYRELCKKQNPDHTGQEPYNFVMTYFTNLESKDLQIFPYHRIVKKFDASLDFLEENFRIDKIKDKNDMSLLLAKAGLNEHAFGVYTKKDGYRLIRLKSKAFIDDLITEGSPDYRRLDATILQKLVLEPLGIESHDIVYDKDFTVGVDMVDDQKAEAVFIMNPVKISQLTAIALNGERMPPKSTYFYPKILSGLTVYKMDESAVTQPA
jgi:uncharacterized protein (DUF1015 family)